MLAGSAFRLVRGQGRLFAPLAALDADLAMPEHLPTPFTREQ
jgi:hypothetical protein